jgi:hypothetical protein
MALGWFLCPIVSIVGAPPFPWRRICAMIDFNPQIQADGGNWAESEVLGNVALVKVRASDTTLATIQAATGFLRVLSKIDMTETMTDADAHRRNARRPPLGSAFRDLPRDRCHPCMAAEARR